MKSTKGTRPDSVSFPTEVIVVFEVDCHDLLQGEGHGIAIPKGTTLIGTWAEKQPTDFTQYRVIVNTVHWTFASDDVTITCPISRHALPGEQERIAAESLRQARICEEQESLADAERWYARALVEYEASGASNLFLAEERLAHADLLLQLDNRDEAILGLQWAISVYEQEAFDTQEDSLLRIDAADQAAHALIKLGEIYFKEPESQEHISEIIKRLLALQKLLQNRAAVFLTLLLSVCTMLCHVGEWERASSTFDQAQALYEKQFAHRPHTPQVSPLTAQLGQVVTLLYGVKNDIPVPLQRAPQDVHQGDAVVLYDIATLLGEVIQGERIELTKSGFLLKRIRGKLRSFLQGQSRPAAQNEGDGYPDLLIQSMENLGLLSRSTPDPDLDEEKPFFGGGRLLPEWEQLTLREQCLHFLHWWKATTFWWDSSEQSTSYALFPLQPSVEARVLLLSSLQRFPVGQWFSIRSLLYLIWKQHPHAFFKERANSYGNYSRAEPLAFTDWERSEGGRFTGILCATLCELGLVSLGFAPQRMPGESRRPEDFALTALGGTVITGETFMQEQDPNETGSLVIQPTYDVLVLRPDLLTLYSLLPFCRIKRIGLASTLVLTRESVVRGRAAGMSLETMLSILEEKSKQQELPQNVVYSLKEWAAAFREPMPPPAVSLEQVFLIRVGSEQVADALCLSPRLQSLGIKRISSFLLAIDLERTSLQEIRKALKKVGVTVLPGQIAHRISPER